MPFIASTWKRNERPGSSTHTAPSKGGGRSTSGEPPRPKGVCGYALLVEFLKHLSFDHPQCKKVTLEFVLGVARPIVKNADAGATPAELKRVCRACLEALRIPPEELVCISMKRKRDGGSLLSRASLLLASEQERRSFIILGIGNKYVPSAAAQVTGHYVRLIAQRSARNRFRVADPDGGETTYPSGMLHRVLEAVVVLRLRTAPQASAGAVSR